MCIRCCTSKVNQYCGVLPAVHDVDFFFCEWALSITNVVIVCVGATLGALFLYGLHLLVLTN